MARLDVYPAPGHAATEAAASALNVSKSAEATCPSIRAKRTCSCFAHWLSTVAIPPPDQAPVSFATATPSPVRNARPSRVARRAKVSRWRRWPFQAMRNAMPDDLYEHDVLAWSERQAELLRRVARGERVNDVDWDHVVEEIEDVGLSHLYAVRSHLFQMLVLLLKLHGWPDIESEQHWRAEIDAFQIGLMDRFAPSMRQRIDIEKIHARAVRQIGLIQYGGKPALAPPATCPVTLDQLLSAPVEDLEAAFSVRTAA